MQSSRAQIELLDTDMATKDPGAAPSVSSPIRRTISGRQYSCLVKNGDVQFSDGTNDDITYKANIDEYLP